jgi:hypothetical protein
VKQLKTNVSNGAIAVATILLASPAIAQIRDCTEVLFVKVLVVGGASFSCLNFNRL